jgi:hypothetical protein
MKLKVRKKLALEGCKPVAAIMGKDSGLSESGKYMVVEADKEGLSYTVYRSDIVGKATINSKSVPSSGDGKSLLEIGKEGRFVTDGSFFFGLLSKGKMDSDFEVEFEPKPALTKKKDEGEEESGLEPIGTAKLSSSEFKATIGCVEDRVPAVKEFAVKKSIMFKASVLARALFEVAVAAGEATMNQDFTNVKIYVSAGTARIATTNGQQLAIVKVNCDGEFTCIAPFSILSMAIKSANLEKDVIIATSKDDKAIMIQYPLTYGGTDVGTVEYQLPSFDKFPKYEKRIENISTVCECTVLTEELKNACSILSIVDMTKTRLRVEPSANKITFQKTSATGSLDEVSMPLVKASGKDIEVSISARHLEVVVAKADQEQVDLVFSGRNSLCKIKFGEFEQYFAPYTEA